MEASNVRGVFRATFNLGVVLRPPVLAYPDWQTVDGSTVTVVPLLAGSAVESITLSQPLPQGLELDPKTGAIHGVVQVTCCTPAPSNSSAVRSP